MGLDRQVRELQGMDMIPSSKDDWSMDAPIAAQYRAQMQAIAEALDEILNGKGQKRKTGFVLLVFPFHDHGGRCNYISNGADRKDIVSLLREQAARFEGSPDITGRA